VVENPDTDSPLAVLGFDRDAQRVYGVVLRNPRSSEEDIAWMSGVARERLQRALTTLREAALVRHDEDLVVPLPPEDAVGRLIVSQAAELREERERLDKARRMLPDYLAQHHSSAASTGESVTVELIRGRDLVGLLRELAATAPGDMLWMRPDQWMYDDGRRADDVVRELMAEGRPSRVLYPARALEEAPAIVRARADSGEQVRLLASVPTRMAILGTSVALLPQRLGRDAERVLLIRQDAIVGALRLLFESLWESGLSVPGFDAVMEQDALGERRLLLQQLSSGAKDEQIARALGVSLRTVRRRVAEIMVALGAESRFQAGTEAVRRGWL
jgi:hypothetical protein